MIKSIIDETELRLKAERDQLKEQLNEKQNELDEYRNIKQDSFRKELSDKYLGKIIRVKQFWRGMSPMNTVELIYNYFFFHVQEIKYRWNDSTDMLGRVLDVKLDPDGFDIADHLTDREYQKADFSICGQKILRVDDKDIDGIYTEDEVIEIVKRVREAQDEMVNIFLKGEP